MSKNKVADYFEHLNNSLKGYERSIPFLLVDFDKLDQNINTLQSAIQPNKSIRIVVKSLPAFELIDYTMKKLNSNNLMVFHQPFLTHLTNQVNGATDILLGKPMPIKTASYYYKNLPVINTGFDPYHQIQWLVDTEKRVQEYIQLAEKLGKKLRLNFEINVGLNRGGFEDLDQLRSALNLVSKNRDKVTFSGFMGYDPHIVKIPGIIRSQQKSLRLSNQMYTQCKDLVKEEYPNLWAENLTFNGAGSPTINLHNTTDSPLNDIAAGSCLVKPTTFDIDSLQQYIPACFIATPVLKKMKGTTLPGLEKFKKLLSFSSSKNQQSFFIYGGFWKADYCYPKDVQENSIFGPSTNQTMVNASNSTNLEVDDFVFLRPHQSEFVFLQFGDILKVRNGRLEGVMKNLTASKGSA